MGDPSFRDARKHLESALEARAVLVTCWNDVCENEGFSSHVIDDGAGEGRLVVEIEWPTDSKAAAEAASLTFAEQVRAALDVAVLAAAHQVSGVVGPIDEQLHSFPLCHDEEAFITAIEAGALRGLRPDQVFFIEELQPYLSRSSPPHIGLAQLAAMVAGDRPATRPRVAVWAHSAQPAVRTQAPAKVWSCTSTGDGVLETSRTVATFAYDSDGVPSFTGNPDLAFDPIFDDEPWPSDPDDNLQKRTALLVAVARAVIRSLEASIEAVPNGGRAFANGVDRQAPSSWGSAELPDSDFGREVAAALADSNIGLGVFTDADGQRVMLLRSADGVYARPVSEALPLSSAQTRGAAAEEASLTAATMWGLPDFVMRPRLMAKGDGVREVGDGTIIVGRLGLAVQVKSRTDPTGDDDREGRWLAKKAREGASQASGTIRTLRRQPVQLMNGRGREIECDGRAINWVRVVIIDHSSLPEGLTFNDEIQTPLVVLLRRDWDFLFDQLRSASAVVDYLHRVSKYEPQPIGEETVRYYELAQADEDADPDPLPGWADLTGATHFSGPLLPKVPANSADTIGHGLFRVLLDDIAESRLEGSEAERLAMLARLDRFGVGHRAELGRLLLNHLDDVASVDPDSTKWRFRRVIQDRGELHLAFGACSKFTQMHREAFRQWTLLRHYEFVVSPGRPAESVPVTVAVLLTPRVDGLRPWDTTVVAIEGPIEIDPAELEAIRELWAPRPMDIAS